MKSTGERYIPGQNGIIEIEHLNRYYFVTQQIDLSKKIVLDIASGEGYGSNILSKYAKEVVGVDISREAIKHAAKKYTTTNLTYVQGDATSIPFPNQTFDIVVSFETIEHHDKHNEMMLEIKRVLKDDGILIISSPDKLHYSDLPKHNNPYHVKELYYDEFRSLIKMHFDNSLFYAQRIFLGSIIALDEEVNGYSKPTVIDEDGKVGELTPVYNIAFCSNTIKPNPKNQIVLYKKSEELIANLENTEEAIEIGKQLGMKIVRNSNAYRLGKFLLKPFSILRNKLNL